MDTISELQEHVAELLAELNRVTNGNPNTVVSDRAEFLSGVALSPDDAAKAVNSADHHGLLTAGPDSLRITQEGVEYAEELKTSQSAVLRKNNSGGWGLKILGEPTIYPLTDADVASLFAKAKGKS